MPEIVISFVDGEVLHAATPDITFDLPIIETEVRSVDANTEIALVPLQAIRLLLVGTPEPVPPSDDVEQWDRAAFHFLDGQVLRASIAPDAMLGRHGGVWRLVEQGQDEIRTMAIPYSSLKGIFRLRQWDSRPFSERIRAGDPARHLDQLARILAERDLQLPPAAPVASRPLMRRMRRGQRRRDENRQAGETTPTSSGD